MAITFKEDWHNQWVGKDLAHTFTFNLFDDTDQSDYNKTADRTATITITKPGGGDLDTAVEDAAVTAWASSDNTVTYTLVAGNTGDVGQGYRGVLKIVDTATSETFELPFFFDVVRFKPVVTITDTDLTDMQPELSNANYRPSGQSNWNTQLVAAWRQLLRDIRSMMVRLPDLALDPQTLREAHMRISLAYCYATLFKTRDEIEDPFWGKHLYYMDEYKQILGRLHDIRDVNESGHVDSDEERIGPRRVWGVQGRG